MVVPPACDSVTTLDTSELWGTSVTDPSMELEKIAASFHPMLAGARALASAGMTGSGALGSRALHVRVKGEMNGFDISKVRLVWSVGLLWWQGLSGVCCFTAPAVRGSCTVFDAWVEQASSPVLGMCIAR